MALRKIVNSPVGVPGEYHIITEVRLNFLAGTGEAAISQFYNQEARHDNMSPLPGGEHWWAFDLADVMIDGAITRAALYENLKAEIENQCRAAEENPDQPSGDLIKLEDPDDVFEG